jgi:hypothetical protein
MVLDQGGGGGDARGTSGVGAPRVTSDPVVQVPQASPFAAGPSTQPFDMWAVQTEQQQQQHIQQQQQGGVDGISLAGALPSAAVAPIELASTRPGAPPALPPSVSVQAGVVGDSACKQPVVPEVPAPKEPQYRLLLSDTRAGTQFYGLNNPLAEMRNTTANSPLTWCVVAVCAQCITLDRRQERCC